MIKLKKKHLKKIEKLKRVHIDLLTHQRDWEKLKKQYFNSS